MSDKATRILLVDDHKMFSDGIKQLLQLEKGWLVCGQIFDGSHLFHSITQNRPEILLLDVNLPNKNGLDLAKIVIKHYPKIKIVLLSMFDDPQLIASAKKIGVHGYILKNSSSETLISGIRSVLLNKPFFPETKKTTEEPALNNSIKKIFLLTPREIEILRLIKLGMSSKQISEKINLSYLTIKTHRRNIHFKLKTETTAELIHFAIENGI